MSAIQAVRITNCYPIFYYLRKWLIYTHAIYNLPMSITEYRHDICLRYGIGYHCRSELSGIL